MKRQTRPFIVEVKHKRAPSKKQSIWGDFNIAAVAAETMRDLDHDEPTYRSLIDSGAPSIDVASDDNPLVEHDMPDPQEAETVEAVAEAPATAEAPEPQKKAPRPKKAKATPKRRIAKEAAKPASKMTEAQPTPTPGKRKIYSKMERVQKLAQIEKAVAHSGSIKSAVSQAGISEQTYYHWKKTALPASIKDDLPNLDELEAEHKRLKKRLAEWYIKENAEMKQKLGEA